MTTVIFEDKNGNQTSRYIDDGYDFVVYLSPYGSLHVRKESLQTRFVLDRMLREVERLR